MAGSRKKKTLGQKLQRRVALAKVRFMKTRYKLRNNTRKNSPDLLFFGCNFPGYFPETTRVLIDLYAQRGIDFSIDCCGKPLFEARDKEYVERSRSRLAALFSEKGVKRLICACPNCYQYFNRLKLEGIEIVTLFASMRELGLGARVEDELEIFVPCSDRPGKGILDDARFFAPHANPGFKHVICCGAAGFNTKRTPIIRDAVGEASASCGEAQGQEDRPMYTYCATCCGMFTQNECYRPKHLVPLVLGTNEETNMSFARNVVALKFYRRGR